MDMPKRVSAPRTPPTAMAPSTAGSHARWLCWAGACRSTSGSTGAAGRLDPAVEDIARLSPTREEAPDNGIHWGARRDHMGTEKAHLRPAAAWSNRCRWDRALGQG